LTSDIARYYAAQDRADDLEDRFICEVMDGEFDDEAREYWTDDLDRDDDAPIEAMRLAYIEDDTAMESAVDKYEAEASYDRQCGGILD
jgi:hypothetical protein